MKSVIKEYLTDDCNLKLYTFKSKKIKRVYIFILVIAFIISTFIYGKLYFQEGIDYYGNFLIKKEVKDGNFIYKGKCDSFNILLGFEELSNKNKLIDLEIGNDSYQYILEPGYLGQNVKLFDMNNNNLFQGDINTNTKSILYDNNNFKFNEIIEFNKNTSIYDIENPDPLLLIMISEDANLKNRGKTKHFLKILITSIFITLLLLLKGTLSNKSKI